VYKKLKVKADLDTGITTNITTKYYYTGSAVLYTANAANMLTTENILDPSGKIIASERFDDQDPNTVDTYADQYFFYHYDKLGSTTAIIQPDGDMVKGYEYDEFGNLESNGSSGFLNEVTFTGSMSDKSTGLQYMNSRYYNPTTGRLLSQDTYSGNPYDPWTQHLYSYCGNNPTSMTDPTGHYWKYIYQPPWEIWVPDPLPYEGGGGGGNGGNGGGNGGGGGSSSGRQ